jgi:2-iminobutanoate/2-iminopropanoate deaminase
MNRLMLFAALAPMLVGCHCVHATLEFEREVIAVAGAPEAIGPYSQAIGVGPMLFVAGQIPTDPATGQMVEGGIEAQTRRAMENIKAIVEGAGFSMSDIAQCQVFLADLNDYAAMNAVYATYFPEAPPARAALQVARIPRDARVEILATAVKYDDRRRR